MVQTASSPRAAPAAPQERIGRYEVLRRIATGGMAELFLAKHVGMEGFEKVVAIKRILAHLAHDDEFVNMFRDEARLVAKLSHPNIVQIYDLGKSADSYFIAMEYIPGRNLASIAKKARQKGEAFPPLYIARAMAQACEALHYAHTRQDVDGRSMGIVHRDVSPQNIILSFSGAVKLVDFGIAKAATKIAHTRAGVLKGKYAYMSPEQIKGEEIDARSDLFSVGIVLFELLCGRRPFEKENSIQTLKAIVQDAHVDPRSLNPAVPDGLADIIRRALVKDRNQRFQSAQEVQLALEDFVASTAERINAVVVGEWLSRLFDDELDRGKGGVVQLKGGGEIILPESEKMERSDRELASDVPLDDDEPVEAAEAPPAPAAPGVRGGGSVMGRGASVAGERLRLLEEGVIAQRRASAGRGDEEATAIAAGDEPDLDEAALAVGPARAMTSDDRRALYEEVEREASAAEDTGYDDSHTELAGGVLAPGPDVPSPTIDLSAVPRARTATPSEPRSPSAMGVATVAARPPAAPLTPLAPQRLAARTPAPLAAARVSSIPSRPAELEPPLDFALSGRGMFGDDSTLGPDDPWGDKTAAEPSSAGDDDVGVVVRDAPAWVDSTEADDHRPRAGRSERQAELQRLESSGVDPWDDKTTGAVGDPAEGQDSSRVAVFDADAPWGDKTVGVTDDPSDVGFAGDLAIDATAGMSIEEIAAKLNGARGEKTNAMPALFGEATAFSVEHEDRTDWGTSGTENGSTDEWRAGGSAAAPRFAEDALPRGVDRSRNVEVDSSTVAATSADYAEEGIELGLAAAFAYDEPTRGSTGEVEPAKPRNALGAIRLAKVAAAPAGGVSEVGLLDEPTAELGTEQIPSKAALASIAPAPRVPPPKAHTAAPLRPPPAAPSRSAPREETRAPPPAAPSRAAPREESRISPLDPPRVLPARSAHDIPSVSGEGTYNEPVLPPGGAILGDFDLDALLAPAPPVALIGADPFASIGSTRVPPASVSLSEMLLERSDAPGSTTMPPNKAPRPLSRGASGTTLPPGPLKSAANIRGASVAGSAPPRPATNLRAIKEVRRPGGLTGVAMPSPLSSSPPGAGAPGAPGLGMPTDDAYGYPPPSAPAPMAMTHGGYAPGTPSAIPLQLPPPPRARARMSTAQLVTIIVSCVVIAVVLGAIGYVKLRPPSLEIRTSPPGARVFLGGQVLAGVTPLSAPIEPDREYKIRIVREGFEDHESTVRIPRDKKAWMASFTLKPSLRAGPAVPVPSAAPGATAPAPPTP